MATPVTHDGQQWSNAAEDTIELAEPDSSWPDQFVTESRAIKKALHPLNPRIEHFGSTAIPKLPAKPIIDIFIIIGDVSVWPHLVAPLSSLGYIHWAGNPRTDRMFFVKGMPPFGSRRSHHVHVTETRGEMWQRLAFRNYLRAHPEEAGIYEQLKRRLATEHPTDREAYTDAKSAYIESVMRKALK